MDERSPAYQMYVNHWSEIARMADPRLVGQQEGKDGRMVDVYRVRAWKRPNEDGVERLPWYSAGPVREWVKCADYCSRGLDSNIVSLDDLAL